MYFLGCPSAAFYPFASPSFHALAARRSPTQARNVRRDNLDMRRPVWVSAVAAPSAHEVLVCVRIKLQAPRAIDARDCACSMAWRFHAVDATLAFSG